MALYRDIKFFLGSASDRFGAVPTITGSTFSKKEKGYALETGQDKYVQYDRQLLPNGAFSVVVWGKKTDLFTSTRNNIISDNTANNSICIKYSGDNLPRITLGANNTRIWNYVYDCNFHCFIFTITGANQTDINNSTFIVDGIVQTVNTTVSSGTQSARSIFAFVGNGNNINSLLISRIKVYDHVLSTNEINAEQVEFTNAQPISKPKRGFEYPKPTDLSKFKGTGINQGLVAAYNMKPIGNTLVDISGNGNNATMIGSVVNSKSGSLFPNNGYFKKTSFVGLNTGLNANQYTVSMRVKFNELGREQHLFDFLTSVQKYIGSTNKIISTGTTNPLISNQSIIINQWYTINFLVKSPGAEIYINGISDISNTTYTENIITLTATLAYYAVEIGNYKFNGEIADIRIHNRILSPAEIKAYHNSFVKPYIIENFSSYAVGETRPNNWIAGSGAYKVGENVISQGEKVANGNFTSATGWTLEPGWTVSGGTANCNTASSLVKIYSAITTTIGKRYKVSFELSNYVSGGVMFNTTAATYSSVFNANGKYTYEFNKTDAYAYITFLSSGSFVGSIDNISVTEIPPLPTITNGSKYLECVTAGTIAIPSNQAYGTWEWDWYKGADGNSCVAELITKDLDPTNVGGYGVSLTNTEDVRLSNLNSFILCRSNFSYITNNTWYRTKITRTQAGVFTVYIKGGAFGSNWVLVSTTGGSGTNPVTDTTYNASNYFVLDLDANDRFANLVMYDSTFV